MTKDEIESELNALSLRQTEIEIEAKKYVQDKTIPLRERWGFFMHHDLGEPGGWIVHFRSLNEGKWKHWCSNPLEDDLYDSIDRNATVRMERLDECLIDYIGHTYEIVQTYETKNTPVNVTFTQEDYDAWREEVLQLFIKSFKYDW